ncbi:MAG: molybdopterin molybdotransferase MoeA [Sphingomonadales bacterium]|nr:molybdopterin molybdotransferase MoeA [Sphingomonadales bacterium]
MARSPLLPIDQAIATALTPFAPLAAESVAIAEAAGRTLAADVTAHASQPPFAASSMDGYAVRAADTARCPATLKIVDEIPAGKVSMVTIKPGEATRIFTGAPLPSGADAVVMQENTERQGDTVVIKEGVGVGRFVRPAGLDFTAGQVLVSAGARLDARHIAVAAAANWPTLPVRRRPRIGILASGDELVLPGEPCGPGQIVSSNSLALAALIEAEGGAAIDFGIARDTVTDLKRVGEAALAAKLDLLVTSGGASVGEHDLIQAAFGELGLDLEFWRVAMRPGKPLLYGKFAGLPLLGLPGNPVSSLVCGYLFLVPAIRRMLGRTPERLPTIPARLGTALPENDERQEYLRARLTEKDGELVATPFANQDSSMLSPLAAADAFIIRPPFAPPAAVGDITAIIKLS